MEKSSYKNKLDKSVNKDKAKKPKNVTVSKVKEDNTMTIPKEYIDKHED